MTQHLFAYGTLMCEQIMQRVSGHPIKGEPASIHGYRRCAIVGADYPAIVAAKGETVSGVLYRQLPAEAWLRLDEFEGDMYRRVSHCLESPESLRVNVYVFQPAFHHLLSRQEWDYQEFLRLHKSAYLMT